MRHCRLTENCHAVRMALQVSEVHADYLTGHITKRTEVVWAPILTVLIIMPDGIIYLL